MMRAGDMAYLYPLTPLPGLRLTQSAALAPAYMSGAVFIADSLDAMTVQAYTNHGAHKIVLKLMHQW